MSGLNGGVMKLVKTAGPKTSMRPDGMRFDVKKWRGKAVLARRLTMQGAKAFARDWNSGKPAHEWVVIEPAK